MKDELDIIKKVDANPQLSRKNIAEELNLPVSTVNKREALTQKSVDVQLNRKRIKHGKYKEV